MSRPKCDLKWCNFAILWYKYARVNNVEWHLQFFNSNSTLPLPFGSWNSKGHDACDSRYKTIAHRSPLVIWVKNHTFSHIGFVFLRDTKENFRRKFSCLMPKTNGSASVSYSFSAPPRNSVYHLVQLHDSWIVICFLKKQTIFLHDIATSIQFCLFSNRILFGETRYKESWKIFKIYSYLLIDSPRKKSGKRLNRNQKKYIRSQKSKLTYLLGCQVIYMLHEKKLNVSLRACILTFNLISFCVNDQDPLQTRVPKWQRCWYYVYVKVFNANQSLAAKFNAFYFNSLFTLDEYWNFQNTIPKRRTWNWP